MSLSCWDLFAVAVASRTGEARTNQRISFGQLLQRGEFLLRFCVRISDVAPQAASLDVDFHVFHQWPQSSSASMSRKGPPPHGEGLFITADTFTPFVIT